MNKPTVITREIAEGQDVLDHFAHKAMQRVEMATSLSCFRPTFEFITHHIKEGESGIRHIIIPIVDTLTKENAISLSHELRKLAKSLDAIAVAQTTMSLLIGSSADSNERDMAAQARFNEDGNVEHLKGIEHLEAYSCFVQHKKLGKALWIGEPLYCCKDKCRVVAVGRWKKAPKHVPVETQYFDDLLSMAN